MTKPAAAVAAASPQTTPILGECVLKLSRSTTYEPPLYLFPELLPPVPQGTPPLPVWDAVADAVDIAASSWRVADATQLIAAGVAAAGASGIKPSTAVERRPQAMVTLTSMIAKNRLLAAGLDATVLEKDAFSSAAIITHLAALQARMGLSDEEGAAIMSNHFINLLAWQKLRELNGPFLHAGASRAEQKLSEREAAGSAAFSPSLAASPPSRKRSRAVHDGDERDVWLPSPHPWASEAELAASDGSRRFVAASETNVEKQVELLHTLAELYQRPWRTLASRGQQTDFVVPPGTVNVTSPFADNSKVPGALLDPATALGWGATLSSSPNTDYFGGVRVAHTACFYAVVLSTAKPASAGSAAAPAPTRLPLEELTTYFGRESGVRGAAAAAAAAATPITGALAPYTTHPEVLSRFQFALVLRPVYEHTADAHEVGRSDSNSHLGKREPLNDDEASESDADAHHGHAAVLHTKRPHHYTLWLVNYGRNGVRVAGRGWVLGEPRQLKAGDVLIVGSEAQLRVEEHFSAAAARAPVVSDASLNTASVSSSQVKQERMEEEEE
ncbi:conserved hypothetical protein [Leishmania mexicana MHOM/GT/2001/U1103]|uniref:FHA domain-containing protein n=1 Tax=Leishmania mexicana (strain MHOM/GT/2001/U1103) TaxID=929439 RepID=E9B6C9_LEIMU|nr:conserved hypothetical protein [Leishmania mexicana MHOM/GT/2001/U1103]CBZ30801.1 conserved hypothetical protein [Leishmania mexicana MHOM/GT/2001/U1103]